MNPNHQSMTWPDITRQIVGWPYPPGWSPVARLEFGGDWFAVHLTRGLDETDAVVIGLDDATGPWVGECLDRLMDEAIGMPEAGEPLTAGEIVGEHVVERWIK